MFWDTKDPPSHNIEILLESPDTKVELFLEEDNIIQECKTSKKNIINYFTRPDIIRRLIELITTEPPEEVPLSERFRHANVACEILTMGLPSLDEKLLADRDTLNMLYSYLENEPPLNPLIASFFSKTFSMLFTKKPDQDWFLYQQTCLKLLEYLKSQSNFLDLICKHFTTPIVPDLIMEIMHNVEGVQLKRSLFRWLNEKRLVEKLIEIIGDPEQSEKHSNVADFLCDLIHQGRTMRQDIDSFEPAFEGSNPILKNIESATTLFALFNVILQPNAVESAIVSGITVVLKIIKPLKVTDERNMERFVAVIEREKKIHDEFLTTVIRAIEPQLKHFNELLKNPPKKQDITSAANRSPPFGMTRLQICRVFTVLLETKNEEISKAICETDFLDVLLSLFKEYCWNNFLHTEVEKCFHNIFPHAPLSSTNASNNSTHVSDGSKDNRKSNDANEQSDLVFDNNKFDVNTVLPQEDDTIKTPDSTPSTIQTHAIVNCKIISKLIECWRINKELESAEKGRRLGYMGHLINIFNHIILCMSESEHVGALIESNLQDDNECRLWQSIVNTTDGEVTKALNAQRKLLANYEPITKPCDYEPCDYNLSLDYLTDNNGWADAFNDMCTLMDSSNADVIFTLDYNTQHDDHVYDDDDGDDDDYNNIDYDNNEGKDKPQRNDDVKNALNLFQFECGNDKSGDERDPFLDLLTDGIDDLQLGFSTSNATEATASGNDTPVDATTATYPAEYDNNANVEKSSSPWSGGDFTLFEIPKTGTQYSRNFVVDDYEDDEGMWTKPLGASASKTAFNQTVPEIGTQSAESTNQTTYGLKKSTMTNDPFGMSVEGGEHVLEKTSTLNQLNNSIEDNSLVAETIEDITSNENKEETYKKINYDLNLKQENEKEEEEEETTSKHKSHALDTNDTTTDTTTTTTNELTNTPTANEEISEDSTPTTTT